MSKRKHENNKQKGRVPVNSETKNTQAFSQRTSDMKIHEQELVTRVSELEVQLKQALSDYQVLKRDMEKRLQFEGDMLRADVLRSILGIADDMDIALTHKDSDDIKSWRDGLVMILQKIQETISQTGAQVIPVQINDSFDPSAHEAVGIVNEGKDGTIAQVVQNGYVLGEKVIRPARVIVRKNSPKK